LRTAQVRAIRPSATSSAMMPACRAGPHRGAPDDLRDVGLLHDVLGLGQRTEDAVRQVDQLAPLAHDRARPRIG
jgi:hypothetical protein